MKTSQSPLSLKINKLQDLDIDEIGSVTRFGYWVLGRDMFGDEEFEEFFPTAQELATKRGKTAPDWRDWDHLHAHYLLHRDIFLTWDEGICCLSDELFANFNVTVMKPEEFLFLSAEKQSQQSSND